MTDHQTRDDPAPAAERRLERELADARLLQRISTELIHQDDLTSLYNKLLEAASIVMRSGCATMRILDPQHAPGGALRLLAWSGMSPLSLRRWEWVTRETGSACAAALRAGSRVVVPDIEASDLISEDARAAYRAVGIRAAQCTPLRSRDGALLGMMSTHWREPHEPSERELGLLDTLARQAADLIERARADAALRAREAELRFRSEQFEMLLNRAPLGVYLVDSDLRLQQINPVASAILPAMPESPIGRDFGEIARLAWQERCAEHVVRTFRHTLESGESYVAQEPAAVHTEGGAPAYYEWWVDRITLPDGRHGAVCYFRNVSDQVRARLSLAASEERYRSLFVSMDEGFCVVEVLAGESGKVEDCRFVEINRAFEKQAGLRDVLGRRVRDLLPELGEDWFDVLTEVAETGKPARFVRWAGPLERWFDVYAFRLGSPAERRVAVLFRDVTEQKRAEAALKQADQRKDEFLATLAHELRNPLGAIRLALNVIKASRHDPERLADMSGIMERQSRQLVRLIDDLMDVSRIARGKVTLRRQPADLAAIIHHAVEAVRSLCDTKDQRLSLSLPPQPVLVHADPLRLAQVVTNLLGNAHKFTHRGGTIRLIAEEDHGWGSIRVRDTGVGIPPDELDRIFGMFEQVEGAYSPAPGGLGIGLSLARSLVELHGGTIQAFSEGRGKGSEFVVRIPGAGTEALAGERRRHREHARIGTIHRIVAVDDNFDALEAVAAVLRMRGHEVELAESGQQALELARTSGARIMLLDIGLPDMDGYEVAERIRSEPWGKHLFLVAVTGWGQEKDKLRARAAGFDAHLTKPVDPDVLERVLAAVDQEGRDRRWR